MINLLNSSIKIWENLNLTLSNLILKKHPMIKSKYSFNKRKMDKFTFKMYRNNIKVLIKNGKKSKIYNQDPTLMSKFPKLQWKLNKSQSKLILLNTMWLNKEINLLKITITVKELMNSKINYPNWRKIKKKIHKNFKKLNQGLMNSALKLLKLI